MLNEGAIQTYALPARERCILFFDSLLNELPVDDRIPIQMTWLLLNGLVPC